MRYFIFTLFLVLISSQIYGDVFDLYEDNEIPFSTDSDYINKTAQNLLVFVENDVVASLNGVTGERYSNHYYFDVCILKEENELFLSKYNGKNIVGYKRELISLNLSEFKSCDVEINISHIEYDLDNDSFTDILEIKSGVNDNITFFIDNYSYIGFSSINITDLNEDIVVLNTLYVHSKNHYIRNLNYSISPNLNNLKEIDFVNSSITEEGLLIEYDCFGLDSVDVDFYYEDNLLLYDELICSFDNYTFDKEYIINYSINGNIKILRNNTFYDLGFVSFMYYDNYIQNLTSIESESEDISSSSKEDKISGGSSNGGSGGGSLSGMINTIISKISNITSKNNSGKINVYYLDDDYDDLESDFNYSSSDDISKDKIIKENSITGNIISVKEKKFKVTYFLIFVAIGSIVFYLIYRKRKN